MSAMERTFLFMKKSFYAYADFAGGWYTCRNGL